MRVMIKLFRSHLWLLAVLFLLSGCTPQDLPEDEDTAILPAENTEEVSHLPESLALPYAPFRTLDPLFCEEGMQQTLSSLLYEGLFRLDDSFQPQPLLCETYAYEAEFCRYVFTLRSDVTFSDGTPLTGADVKATLDRARTSPRYKNRLSHVTSVAAGDNTVTVILSEPNIAFPALLDIPITKQGSETAGIPVGTGPYFFSQEENSAYLIANQSWWQGEVQPAERITLVEADGHDAMLYRFTSRDVHLISADLTGTQTVSITGDVDVYDTPTTAMQYVGINTARLTDPALRQALSLAIDRENITEAYLSGHAIPCQFPLSPQTPLYPSVLETHFSPDSFSAALARCSQLPDHPLTFLVNAENPFKVSIAQAIAANCTAAGLAVETVILPWEEYLSALEQGRFDLYYAEVRLTADWDLRSLLSSRGTLNYGKWSDPQTEEFMAQYSESGNIAPLCEYLMQQCPILPVCFKSTSVLTQSEVLQNLSPTAAEPFALLSDIAVYLKS